MTNNINFGSCTKFVFKINNLKINLTLARRSNIISKPNWRSFEFWNIILITRVRFHYTEYKSIHVAILHLLSAEISIFTEITTDDGFFFRFKWLFFFKKFTKQPWPWAARITMHVQNKQNNVVIKWRIYVWQVEHSR